jgi:hypothetical protein
MPYGTLTSEQEKLVERFVRGQVVYDLGAGDLYLTCELLRLGAVRVIAIDKEDFRRYGIPDEVVYRKMLFRDVKETSIDTAFVSWPSNYDNGLLPLLRRSKTIIYLGKNTDGTACGIPSMFRYLLKRKAECIPDRKNTLICYTDVLEASRIPLKEEEAAIVASLDAPYLQFLES